MKKIQEILDARAKVTKEMRDLKDQIDKEDRQPNAEESEKFDALDKRWAELTEARDLEQKLEEREAEDRKLAESRPDLIGAEDCDSNDPAERAAVGKEKRNAIIRRALIRPGGSLVTRDYSGDSQNIGDNGDGAYIVPNEFMRRLLEKAVNASPMRGQASVMQTSEGQLTVPYISEKPAAAQKDEKATYATGNIEFLTTTIDVHKITNSIPVTEEMLTDSAFDIEALIIRVLGETIGTLENTWFTTGSGSDAAYGVVTGAEAGVTADSATAVTGDELIETFHELHSKYRARASWMMKDGTIAALRKLKDGNQRYLWQDSLQSGSPDRLLNRPVIANEAMASLEASAVPIVFGDLSQYIIADRAGMRMVNDPYTNATTGVIVITASKRTGGRLPLDEAVQKLTMASS